MDWTPEQIFDLTRLWAEGQSTGEIAKVMGISKNAVVGKAHRLHLAARPSPIRRARNWQPKPLKAYQKPPCPRGRPKSTGGGMPSMPKPRDLTREQQYEALGTTNEPCQYIEGSPGSPVCGKGRVVNKPFCPTHSALCYDGVPAPAPRAAP